MRPAQIEELLPEFIRPGSNQPPLYLWGPPGIGKSDCVRAAAAKLDLDVIDLRAVLLDPVDLRGLPKIGAKDVKWVPPNFWPVKGQVKRPGIIFLDELAQAPPMVVAGLLQGILDHRMGEVELDPSWKWVAASNRSEDRAGAHRLITPMLNRFVHIDLEVDNDDWQKWAVANEVSSDVRFFLMARPQLLHSFDASKNERAFPTPRSWAFASKVLRALEGKSEGLLLPTLTGTVGEGAALEFVNFLRTAKDLPTWADIMSSPGTVSAPQRADAAYAVCGIIEAGSRKMKEPAEARALVRYLERLPMENCVIAFRSAYRLAKVFREVPETVEWLGRNRSLMIG